MIHFVTDICGGEPDILGPDLSESLTVKTLDGDLIACVPPPSGGWTHTSLVVEAEKIAQKTGSSGADAFLGSSWVGSTEV